MDCLFCKIVNHGIRSKVEFENEEVIAFHDVNPQAPIHLLIVPKKHLDQISLMQTEDIDRVGKLLYYAKEIAAKNGWEYYRLVLNNGSEAGQSVFHVHLHLLSGRHMTWPPG